MRWENRAKQEEREMPGQLSVGRGACKVCNASMVAAAVCMGSSAAWAGSIGIVADRDNTLYENQDGLLSNGAGEAIFTGRTNEPSLRRALLHFDVDSYVPAGATIESATLVLFLTLSVSEDSPVSVHTVLADWGEGASDASGAEGMGAAAQPGDATWAHTFYNTSFWSNPGGDFAPDPLATTSVGGGGAYQWSSAGMIADVQSWLDKPTANFGWIMIGDESINGSAKRFASRTTALPDAAPVLLLEYSEVPGPSGIAIFAMAGVLGCGRRRRHRLRMR